MAIVTISRMYGSGGSLVARRVADALGWDLLDNAVVDSVADRLGARLDNAPTMNAHFHMDAPPLVSARAFGIKVEAIEKYPGYGYRWRGADTAATDAADNSFDDTAARFSA